MLAPAKRKPTDKRVTKKAITRKSDSKSIPPRTGATAKQRSVLRKGKYGLGKAGGTPYLNLYKALLEETSRNEKD